MAFLSSIIEHCDGGLETAGIRGCQASNDPETIAMMEMNYGG